MHLATDSRTGSGVLRAPKAPARSPEGYRHEIAYFRPLLFQELILRMNRLAPDAVPSFLTEFLHLGPGSTPTEPLEGTDQCTGRYIIGSIVGHDRRGFSRCLKMLTPERMESQSKAMKRNLHDCDPGRYGTFQQLLVYLASIIQNYDCDVHAYLNRDQDEIWKKITRTLTPRES